MDVLNSASDSLGRKQRRHNSTYKKLAVQWLNQVQFFNQTFVQVDNKRLGRLCQSAFFMSETPLLPYKTPKNRYLGRSLFSRPHTMMHHKREEPGPPAYVSLPIRPIQCP